MQLRSPRFLPVILVLLLLGACSVVPTPETLDPSAYRHSTPSEYYLYTPAGYSSSQKWPVFVGIHQEGGSGLDCWNTWQPFADKAGFVLVCPSLAYLRLL